jgi:hypothetical protein
VDFLRKHLLELFGCTLLDGLGNLAGAGGVADLSGVLVRVGVVDGIRELVLELGGSLRGCVRTSRSMMDEGCGVYLLLDLAGDLRVRGVGNTLALFVLHIEGCGGVVE